MKALNNLFEITAQFNIPHKVESIYEYGDGHINNTYFIKTKENNNPDYLLQRKNKSIFSPVPELMNNIYKVTNHLKNKIIFKGGDPARECMTIFPSLTGDYFYRDDENEYWSLCLFIPDHIIYQKAHTLELAYKGGKGIGDFQNMLSDLEEPLVDILPGFHNISHRFMQWDRTLDRDAAGRKSRLKKEISWIESRRNEMLNFWKLIECQIIPKRVAHNDTKINNILFDNSGNVLCMIDLDTVMNNTVLNDFGDAVRTFANTGREDEEDLKKITMDFEIFKALSKGYLEKTISFLTTPEIDHLAFSAKYITYEQVLRFLMDYIDGDNYYKIKFKEHNLIRTYAQYKLLQSIEEQYEDMKIWITEVIS